MKKTIALLLSIMMVCSLLGGCGKTTTDAATDTGAQESTASGSRDLTYGLTNDWNTVNFYADSPSAAIYIICDKIFDKLFYKSADGTISERNAESWEWNSDNTELTINLNHDAKWHDGEPVTAYDWEFTFTTMCMADAGYAKGSNNRFIAGTDDEGHAVEGEELGIKAVDDYTLVLTFKENMVDLPTMLQTTNLYVIPVIPKHILGELPVNEVYTNAEYWDAPIGSGPCIFVSHVVNNELVLKSNPDFYLGAPGFDTMTFKKMDPATSLATFESAGDIDVVFPRYNGDNAIEALEKAEECGFEVEQDSEATRICFLLINNNNVSDVRIRQAIQLVIDRDALVNSVMEGLAVPTATYVTDDNPYKNNDIDYSPDLEKAAKLVEEAGYSVDNPLQLTMDTPTGFRATISAYMQQELAKVGIDLVINTTDVSTGFSELSDGIVDMSWIIDTANSGNLSAEWYYNANNEGSYTCVTDTSFDEKMAEIKALQTGDDEEALKAAMYDWQQYIYDQAVIVPLFFQYGINAHSTRLSGASLEDATGENDNTWEWVIAE